MISVVVPIYNLKSFLPRCIESLLNQTVQDYEVILVDDGSTDGSSEICDQYEKKYPDYIHCIHKENGGLSSARNVGMSEAKGDFVIFPDPDDWVEVEYLEHLQRLQMKHNADMVCTGHFIDYDDHRVPSNIGKTIQIMSGSDAQKALFIQPCINGFAWNKLFKLDIIKLHGLLFLDDVGITEDLDFAYRYLQYCHMICFAPELRTYHYYQRSNAITHNGFSVNKIKSIHTYEKILAVVDSSSEIGKAVKEDICNMAINLLLLYMNADDKDEKSYLLIREYIDNYYDDYLNSTRYGKGRKIQAMLAKHMPRVYCVVKNFAEIVR